MIFDASKLVSELPESIQTPISKVNLELEALKIEYKKQIEAFKAEKYLMDSKPSSKKIPQYYVEYEELNKKYEDSFALLLHQIQELE